MFEREADMTVFLEHLGAACKRGEIEVHAFAVLTTHYHMLVRSPVGRLKDAMQRVQTEYSRWFNRGRRRDGPLVRGRYAAKVVDSHRYRRAVVGYIDRNPVSAGLVLRAADYPYGSARIYGRDRVGECAWLERGWVEGEVIQSLGLPAYDPARYTDAFGELPSELARVVEARWRFRVVQDPLEDLVRAAPEAVVEWMRRKARLADGTRPGLPVLAPETVDAAIRAVSRGDPEEWTIGRRSGWLVVRVGLARQLCGLRMVEISESAGLTGSAVGRIARLHARLILSDQAYARRVGAVVRLALGVWEAEGK